MYLGIDFGGSYTKIGYGSSDKGIISFRIVQNSFSGDRKSILEFLQHTINSFISSLPDNSLVKGIGFGTPGIVDNSTGIIIGNCPNIKAWEGSNPKLYLEEMFSVPVFIENDADLMVYGESQYSHRRDKSILGITIGTGIGGGCVLNNRIVKSKYTALEIGHCIVIPFARECLCGKKGCVEAYSSVKAIRQNLYEEYNEDISLDAALQLYGQKHYLAVPVFDNAYTVLGIAVGNAITLLARDIVLIGGAITESEFFDLEPLKFKIKAYLNGVFLQHTEIETAQLKNKAAVWGGIVLAENEAIGS